MDYIIDTSVPFTGLAVASMSDGVYTDLEGYTLEELRIKNENPNLMRVSAETMKRMTSEYYENMVTKPAEEITEDEYYELFGVVPPERVLSFGFFMGERYAGDISIFCFKVGSRYFKCKKRIGTPKEELSKFISDYI